MTRRLLPYEHQLIEALGISQEEYLEFVALQKAYSDPKAGTSLDVRNAETVAIVLTVVGILFQVGAALLAPKPELPQQKAQRRQREERFAPSTGFNSTQELANYGDPINLIYCNTSDNKKGAVRVTTSLVWSAVSSYGSSQFMQLLLVLGAAKINKIDYARIGIGDVPLGVFSRSNTWLYYNENGAPTYNDIEYGNAADIDPSIQGRSNNSAVCQIDENRQGFSQAFSPSNRNKFGAYDPVPINVRVMDRRRSGNSQWADSQIVLAGNPVDWAPNNYFKAGDEVRITFKEIKNNGYENNWATRFAGEKRQQLIQSLQRGSIYQLGLARLILISDPAQDINKSDVTFTFRVIRGGRAPYTAYRKTRPISGNNSNAKTPSGLTVEQLEKEEQAVENWLAILQSPATENTKRYYSAVDTTKKEGVTMPSRQVTATGQVWNVGQDRTVEDEQDNAINDSVQTGPIQIDVLGVKYNFTQSAINVTWTDETGKARSLLDAESKSQGLQLIDERGSLAYTRFQLQEFLSNKPKLDAEELREYYGDLQASLQVHINNVASGKFDKDILKIQSSQITWIDQNNVKQTIVGSLARSGFNSDTKPRSPSDQVSEIRSYYLDKINDLERKKEDYVGPKDKVKKFRDETQKKIEDAREDRRNAIRGVIDSYRDALILQAGNSFTGFTNVKGVHYIAGTRKLRQLHDGVKGKSVTDQNGVTAIRNVYRSIIQRKEEAIKYLNDVLPSMVIRDNSDIFTKALVKVNTAWYQTISEVDYVQFALKARIFRRVSGRQLAYGSDSVSAPNWFSLSDNGLHARVAFFGLTISRNGAPGITTVDRLFAVRGTSDIDMFLDLQFSTNTKGKYRFSFFPVADFYAEMQEQKFTGYAFIDQRGERQKLTVKGSDGETFYLSFTGRFVGKKSDTLEPNINEGKPLFTNPWDLFSPRADTDIQFSFENGPEFTIAAVTEQQKGSTSNKYKDMSTLALGVFSGQGMQDLRSITAYVTKGKSSYVINKQGEISISDDSTCYAPDIFLDTVKNRLDGIGNYASEECIDLDALADAKRYCVKNNFFMDGVIAEQRPWREFWAEVAQYSLLEFARKNGREALVPALPHNADGSFTREIKPTGLFTSGNILEGTYKEEHLDYGSAVQDLIATVIYRNVESSDDIFSPKASVTVSRKETNESNAIRETYDLSQFVSNREQAIIYAKYRCNQRYFIRRGIEFKTLPTQVPIEPGGYILVDMGLTPWHNLTTGVVMQGGELNSPLIDNIRNGTYTALLYKDSTVRTETNVTVTNGVASALASRYVGFTFVLGEPTAQRARTFRVTEVTLDDQGEVTVKAIRAPCTVGASNELLSNVADFSEESFVVSG